MRLTGLNVLWLMPYPPLPARHGGQLRVSNLMKRVIAEGASVEVLYPETGSGRVPQGAAATTYAARGRTGLREKIACAASPYPDYVWTALPTGSSPTPRHRPDVVVASQPHQWPMVEGLAHGAPVLLDTQNIETDLYRQLASSASKWVTTSRLRLETSKSARVEGRALREADLVVAVSERDQRAISAVRSGAVPVIRNGVDLDYFTFSPRLGALRGRLVMTGTLGYEPNRLAARWLAEELLPTVQRTFPEATATIVGGAPTPDITALDGRGGVRVFSDVPDIRPYTDDADIFVAPLRIGGGTPLKIVEALAQGLPTITTSLIGRAMGIGPDVLYLADSAEEFARQYATVIGDPDDRARRIHAGRELVERGYDWTTLGDDFVALVASLGR